MNRFEELNLMKEILNGFKLVEDKEIRNINPNCFFYGTSYEDIQNDLLQGIKCSYDLTGKRIKSASGPYYIPVCKNIKNYDSSDLSAFNMKATSNISLILDEKLPATKTINTNNNELMYTISKLFKDTTLPIRFSMYKDEYQVLNNIDKKYFCGILFCIIRDIENEIKKASTIPYVNSSNSSSLSNIIYTINFLKDLIVFLNSNNIDLPLYDFSYNREINKRKVMALEIPTINKKRQVSYSPNYSTYI